jgi:hypothetical protein
VRLSVWLPVLALACLGARSLAASADAPKQFKDDGRTVIDNERGGFFTPPFKGDWEAIGAEIALGRGGRYLYSSMDPEAIKGIHGRLQHFEQDDALNHSRFPFSLLMRYEADELAEGRPPLWLTATYQGKKRPLLFAWHATGGWGNSQGVNLRDDRYIKFFIKQYVRGTLMAEYAPTWWVGLDNGTFDFGLYGVWDDAGEFVSKGMRWDRPFPQDAREWTEAAKYCFSRIHEWAPDISFAVNEASQPDESQYGELFKHCDGVMHEGFMSYGTDWYRQQVAEFLFDRYVGPDANKVQLFQVSGRDAASIKSAYVAYLIWRGPNAFFDVRDDEAEVDPARYAVMKNALGRPVGPPRREQEPGKGREFLLFSREVEGGLVYHNLTAVTKTVSLPASHPWYDVAGKPITSLTLKDWEGGFALREPGMRCAWPTINPRRPQVTTGPLAISMATEPWTSGAEIHYTLDGSEPTRQSPRYTGPVTLTVSCLVRARAFSAGLLPSFVAEAAYRLTEALPQVSFYLASDDGSDLLDDYPLVELDHPSAQAVQVNYRATGGSAVNGRDYVLTPGQLVFPPGEKYLHFRVPVIRNRDLRKDGTVEITLFEPKGAALGERKTYTYTILAARPR